MPRTQRLKTPTTEELLTLHPKVDKVDFKQVEEVAKQLKDAKAARGYNLATPATRKRVTASKRQPVHRSAVSQGRQR